MALPEKIGWDLLSWGSKQSWLGAINDWWLQLLVLLGLTLFYAAGMWKTRMPRSLILASCFVLLSLQLLMLSSRISY